MASIPTQEEIVAATRKSQEAMIAAIKSWLETVRTATPNLPSVYAPLAGRLPKLPPVSLPFADKLPTPGEAVDNAYHLAEQLLASQRKFTEDLLEAMTPLIPGLGESPAKAEAEIPSRRVWQEAVTFSEPKPVAVSQPKPATVSEPKPVAVSQPKPAAEPKAPVRRTAKSTPARPAPRTAASAAKSTAAGTAAAKSTGAKSTPARDAAAKSTPGTTPASPAPKGPDAS